VLLNGVCASGVTGNKLTMCCRAMHMDAVTQLQQHSISSDYESSTKIDPFPLSVGSWCSEKSAESRGGDRTALLGFWDFVT
jgi:hypothetical protein